MASNRDRLVEAAAELFYRQGYQSTSVEEVLLAAGVARSNFYYHFSGKSELAEEVVRHWISIYDEELVAPALEGSPGDARSSLRRLFRLAAAFQDPGTGRTGCPLGQLASDLSTSHAEVRRLLTDYFTRTEERIRTMMARDGTLEADPGFAGLAAALTVATLEGGLLLSRLYGDPERVQRVGEALVDLLLNGDPARI